MKKLPLSPKPIILISRCLGYDHCRYNGAMIAAPHLAPIQSVCQMLPICPEMAIGLGVPRPAIRLVMGSDGVDLVQPETGRILTKPMQEFLTKTLNSLSAVDGFILKEKSPSCGLRQVKIYKQSDSSSPITKGPGFLALAIQKNFPNLTIEDEGRLRSRSLREHFLIRSYATFRWRTAKPVDRAELVVFHSHNKLLYMLYNQTAMRRLGRITASAKNVSFQAMMRDYEQDYFTLFTRQPRQASHLNVMQHIFGYASKYLSAGEKEYFLSLLTDFSAGRIPLDTPLSLLWSWVLRFDLDYLAQQTYFYPFPPQARSLNDSAKDTWTSSES